MINKALNTLYLKRRQLIVVGVVVALMLLGVIVYSIINNSQKPETVYSYDKNNPENYYDVPLGNQPCLALNEFCGYCSGTTIASDICRYYKPDKNQTNSFVNDDKYYYCEKEISGKYFKGTFGSGESFEFTPNNPDDVTEFCKEG